MSDKFDVPDQVYIAPIAEPVHRSLWPWAVGALGLAGFAAALTWPSAKPVEVAEPVATSSAVVHNLPAANPTTNPKVEPSSGPYKLQRPICVGGSFYVQAGTPLLAEPRADAAKVPLTINGVPIEHDDYLVSLHETETDGWLPVVIPIPHPSGAAFPDGWVPADAVTCRVSDTR